MKTILFLLLILFCYNSGALGKCPTQSYIIEGQVLDQDKKPIKGSNVLIFLNNEDEGFFVTTSIDGIFKIKCFFDTHVKTINGLDECSSGPSSIIVIVASDGYYVKKHVIESFGGSPLSLMNGKLITEDIVLRKIHPDMMKALQLEK